MPSQDSSLGTALPQGSKDSQIVSRMQINDHKAGMQGLDRERINAIILEASKGNRTAETRCWAVAARNLPASLHSLNSLRPRQNGRHFADDIFKHIFCNENVWIPIKISLKFVPKGPINNIPSLVQIMAWRRPGDKPLSEPIMVRFPMHICVTRPQWVKRLQATTEWGTFGMDASDMHLGLKSFSFSLKFRCDVFLARYLFVWCCQGRSHDLNEWQQKARMPLGNTKPQWLVFLRLAGVVCRAIKAQVIQTNIHKDTTQETRLPSSWVEG